MMKNCSFNQYLSSYIDNELSARQLLLVEAHIETCEECRRETELLRQTDLLLNETEYVEPSEDFDHIFWQKVERIEEKGRRRSILALLFSSWRTSYATGIAGVVIALVAIAGIRGGKPDPEEFMIAENLGLLQEFEIVNQLDLLENWETIKELKEGS